MERETTLVSGFFFFFEQVGGKREKRGKLEIKKVRYENIEI